MNLKTARVIVRPRYDRAEGGIVEVEERRRAAVEVLTVVDVGRVRIENRGLAVRAVEVSSC